MKKNKISSVSLPLNNGGIISETSYKGGVSGDK